MTQTLQTTLAVHELLRLQERFYSMRHDFSRNGGMPRPLGQVALPVQKPDQPTVDLFEGSLRYYPLQLEGVRRGNSLRAFFNCTLPGKHFPVSVCFEKAALLREEKQLGLFDEEPVTEWNLLQVSAAKNFISIIPEKSLNGVNENVVLAFREKPPVFRDKLMGWAITQL